LLASDGSVPDVLASRKLDLGAYPPASQFSRALTDLTADVVILSILPDVATALVRHRDRGFLFYPNGAEKWSAEDRQWLSSEFVATGPLPVEASMANLATIIDRIRRHRDVPILIYNVSPVVPGELIHCHLGLDETYSDRMRRFNAGLVELSRRKGISIIDVDTLVAQHGAATMKLDAVHLSPKAYRLVAEEVVRVLDDLGVFDEVILEATA
jgi:lysophospholipase L1-like esterase